MRNIFSSDELSKAKASKDLKTFLETFFRFSKIVVFLQNALKLTKNFMSVLMTTYLIFVEIIAQIALILDK